MEFAVFLVKINYVSYTFPAIAICILKEDRIEMTLRIVTEFR